MPAPFLLLHFLPANFQGYPLIGVPPDDSVYPLMKIIYSKPCGDLIEESRIKAYGWVNFSANLYNCKYSNSPMSYWLVPNSAQLDQFVLRVERQVDSVQTTHIDVGFRSTILVGIDYRYMTGGGWTSDQLLKHNYLYRYDFTEQYVVVTSLRYFRG